MTARKAEPARAVAPEWRGFPGRLRYAIDQRQSEDPSLTQNELRPLGAARTAVCSGESSVYSSSRRGWVLVLFWLSRRGSQEGRYGGRSARYTGRSKCRSLAGGVTANTVIMLARALRVRPSWLLLGEEPSGLGTTPAPQSETRPSSRPR